MQDVSRAQSQRSNWNKAHSQKYLENCLNNLVYTNILGQLSYSLKTRRRFCMGASSTASLKNGTNADFVLPLLCQWIHPRLDNVSAMWWKVLIIVWLLLMQCCFSDFYFIFFFLRQHCEKKEGVVSGDMNQKANDPTVWRQTHLVSVCKAVQLTGWEPVFHFFTFKSLALN